MRFVSYNYKLFIILFCLLINVGCKKDFLYNPPTSQVIAEQFFINLSSCEQQLKGAYSLLSAPFYNGEKNILYPELVADNIKPLTGSTILSTAYSWSQIATDNWSISNMNTTWQAGYKVLRQLALVVEKVDQFRSEDPVKADDIKAQALSLRALVNFQLINIFSQPYGFTANATHPGIPYITQSDITAPINGRETTDNIYNRIIEDFTTSIPLFNPSNTSKIVMNRYAAMAFLSRVYLFKGDYINAKNYARAVIANIPIMSSKYPEELFTDQETEALFQLLPLDYGLNGTTSSNYAGAFLAEPNPGFVATTDITDLLNEYPDDLRKAWVLNQSGRLLVKKYPVNVIAGFSNPARSYYQTLIRSSEMYLTASECYAKLNNEDSARYYTDQVRSRAIPAVSPLNSTGPALLDSILKERRKELCFEGLRLFDLLRNKIDINRSDPTSPEFKSLPYNSPKVISPIPLVDIQVTGLSQNPTY
jgi:starch-binding outer membrane protein, SusD/RagB family